jgi:hypothetical protein
MINKTNARENMHGLHRIFKHMRRAGVQDPWEWISSILARGWSIQESSSKKTVLFFPEVWDTPRGASKGPHTWIWNPVSRDLWCLEWTPRGVQKWAAPGKAEAKDWIEYLEALARSPQDPWVHLW